MTLLLFVTGHHITARALAAPSVAIGLAGLLGILASPKARAVEVKPITAPYIRTNDALDHMRLDPKGRFIAFANPTGLGLSIVDVKSKQIWRVSDAQVGPSFFWAPDGYRLFYRELSKNLDKSTTASSSEVRSVLKAYDAYLHRNIQLDDMPFPSGILTFDPRDLRLHLMTEKGIHTKRIYFPDERLAKWQIALRTETGKFLATQGGILWITQGGYAMRRLEDDGARLESFDISPDGSTIAWATQDARVYVSKEGQPPRLLGRGRDPRWHPTRPLLAYAGARMVGDKIINYDVRISDLKGEGKFLTTSQYSSERWPQWAPQGDQVFYTVANTTDIYVIDFKL